MRSFIFGEERERPLGRARAGALDEHEWGAVSGPRFRSGGRRWEAFTIPSKA